MPTDNILCNTLFNEYKALSFIFSFPELLVSPVLSKEKVLELMMFRGASLASYVMLGGTIATKEVVAVDKEYVRVNSTELGL